MRKYERNQPLIVIHVPKAGGTTSMKIFHDWFGDGFLTHYFNEQTVNMPHDPKFLGHYNSTERDQEVPTCLRDEFIERHPLEFAVYNYALKNYTKTQRLNNI
jgi:hypothetical protein